MKLQYTNIRLILDKILRHPLMKDLSLETAIDYTIDFIRLVGTPDIFEEKTAKIEILNYRALLPCDFYLMIQVRNSDGYTFRYSTDSFHMSEDKTDNNLTYKLLGNVIFTSLKEGTIEIAYNSIAIDDEGYPLLPDNSSFTRALQAYIKKEWFTILFDLGKILPAILLNVQQEYAWAVGDCTSEFNRLSIDEMESFTNSWNTLIQRASEHKTGFINNGTRQRLKF